MFLNTLMGLLKTFKNCHNISSTSGQLGDTKSIQKHPKAILLLCWPRILAINIEIQGFSRDCKQGLMQAWMVVSRGDVQ